MRVGIIGVGHIGGNCARQFIKAGHELCLSFTRDQARLEALVVELGERASAGSPADTVRFGEVIVVSVPWDAIPEALRQAGSLEGKIALDTTNQFGSVALPRSAQPAAAFNAARMPGARYTKSFNTLTAGFQAEAAERAGAERVVQWICGDDLEAKLVIAELVEGAGYVPVDLGGVATCHVMEAPRRAGAVYGEEYRAADAQAVVTAVRAGRPIPPTPRYR